eukprot:jgi/Undpi1/4831/HiC_scaffold_19.g08184.m1
MYLKPLLFPVAATVGRAIESQGFACITGAARVQRFRVQNRLLFSSAFSGRPSALKSQQQQQHTSTSFIKLTAPFAVGLFPRQARVFSSKTMSTSGGSGEQSTSTVVDFKTAKDVVDFWFGDVEKFASDKEYANSLLGKWWGFGPKDEVFIASQMASKDLIQKAASGELTGEDWDGPQGVLAKIIVLDQFPRTAYRGTAQAFATDEMAASLALKAIADGWDALGANYTFAQRNFLYLPLLHSERLDAQEGGLERFKVLMEDQALFSGKADPTAYTMAKEHHDIIAKFGRFPHRNAALGRTSTPEEEEWLRSGDVPGWAKTQGAPATSG